MELCAGDRIVIRGHHIGEPDRDCEVLEVRGPNGGPPYRVRWGDSGHESLFFPGPDASVEHFEHVATQPSRESSPRDVPGGSP
jgi:Domain of unknown function (DUF1918)